MTTIDVERREGVALVTINNPARKNAVDVNMRRALQERFQHLADDESVRAVCSPVPETRSVRARMSAAWEGMTCAAPGPASCTCTP